MSTVDAMAPRWMPSCLLLFWMSSMSLIKALLERSERALNANAQWRFEWQVERREETLKYPNRPAQVITYDLKQTDQGCGASTG
jgi:hypothetical protein